MSGAIPPQVFMLPNIETIYLQNNFLDGILTNNISTSVLSESKLSEIDLSKNVLNGAFPQSFASLRNLSKLCLLLINDV